MKNAAVPSGYAYAVAITPSNSTAFADGTCDAIYTGDAAAPADIVAVFGGAAAGVTMKAVPAGQTVEWRLSRVHLTGTTATNMVALYRRKP
ncbi:MAG: spike base protein, RCAP_Rcc01079 family [Actinoallomurus sp.]